MSSVGLVAPATILLRNKTGLFLPYLSELQSTENNCFIGKTGLFVFHFMFNHVS